MAKRKRIIICLILVMCLVSIPVIRGVYFFSKGFIALANSCGGESVRWFDKSIKANPYFLEAHVLLAAAYTDRAGRSLHYKEHNEAGFIQLKEKTLGKAEKVLKTALRRFPYHPYRDDIQYMLGRIYDEDSMNGGCIWDEEKAVESYVQLVNKYPNSRYVQEAKERIKVLEQILRRDTLVDDP